MDQSLFNTSGIPILLGMAAVNRRFCVECGSPSTYTLDTIDPFKLKPMRSRICDSCGRVTAGYLPEGTSNDETTAARPDRPPH